MQHQRFHSGTPNPQLLHLLGTDDSIDGIYKNITDCAKISKWAGGIGIHVSNIRSKNTRIRGTNGISSGIIPMLKVYNETAKYVNQSGKGMVQLLSRTTSSGFSTTS